MISDPVALSPVSRLDHWEQRYSTDEYRQVSFPSAFLRSQAHRLKPGQRALAVADLGGFNSVWLARQGLDVVSIEESASALTSARQLAEREHVKISFEYADLLQWNWPQAAFDVVTAIFVQSLSPAEREQVFESMKASLKQGGLLLVQGYTPRQLDFRTGGPSSLEQLYTEELLRDLLVGLDLLELREHESVIREGSGHNGMSGLIEAVGRRAA